MNEAKSRVNIRILCCTCALTPFASEDLTEVSEARPHGRGQSQRPSCAWQIPVDSHGPPPGFASGLA